MRVNAICPGAVAGDRIDRVIAGKAKRARRRDRRRARRVPRAERRCKRFVSADDIANAIVFLASKLGANIDGHALPVDGDIHSLV